ncbi:hypothetical protein ScalyP_jg2717 [Parmales sp. scaly parma]|nr:hypothetical protein ScalyP_jg2717 [Parmales sp. scaly parma]
MLLAKTLFVSLCCSVNRATALKLRQIKNQARYNKIQAFISKPPTTSPQTKQFIGLMEKGDTYDDSCFEKSHLAFKAFHNEVFATLFKNCGSTSAFFLDGPSASTTTSLLAKGFPAKSLFTANIFPDTINQLSVLLPDENVILGRAEEVLPALTSHTPFSSFYFDGCGGDENQLISMIAPVFTNKMNPQVAVGFTLTRATPSGRSLGDREVSVLSSLSKFARMRGLRMDRVEDDPEAFGLDPTTATAWRKEDAGVVTNWVVCSLKNGGSADNNNTLCAVDSHLHLGSGEGGTPEDYKKLAVRNNINKALVIQSIIHRADHSFISKAIRESPTLFKGIALYDPAHPGSFEDIKRLVTEEKFVGVRFNPYLFDGKDTTMATSSEARKVYEWCGENNVVVGIMCFNGLVEQIGDIVNLLESFPATTVAIDHFGFCTTAPDDDEAFQKLLLLEKYPQLYVKVSATFRISKGGGINELYEKRFKPLLDSFGFYRLFWGSDFPFVNEEHGGLDGEKETILKLCNQAKLTPTQQQMIVHQNALRVYDV